MFFYNWNCFPNPWWILFHLWYGINTFPFCSMLSCTDPKKNSQKYIPRTKQKRMANNTTEDIPIFFLSNFPTSFVQSTFKPWKLYSSCVWNVGIFFLSARVIRREFIAIPTTLRHFPFQLKIVALPKSTAPKWRKRKGTTENILKIHKFPRVIIWCPQEYFSTPFAAQNFNIPCEWNKNIRSNTKNAPGQLFHFLVKINKTWVFFLSTSDPYLAPNPSLYWVNFSSKPLGKCRSS